MVASDVREETKRIRPSGHAGLDRMGRRAPRRSQGPDRGIRRGHTALRHRSHPGRGQARLAHRPAEPGRARLRRQGGVRAVDERGRHRNDTTVVFYGDRNNWYASYTFWLFKYYGHGDCRIMDGGRAKWEAEDRPYTREVPIVPADELHRQGCGRFDPRLPRRCAGSREVGRAAHLSMSARPQEYTGEVIHMVGYPQEGAQRAGHVKGARNIPWAKAANADGTFKTGGRAEGALWGEGITADKDDDRLLPDRRAIEPHLVRADLPARLPERPQLRWVLDRVG